MIAHFILTFIICAQPADIVVHFFYSPDCGYCMDILFEDIARLQKQYTIDVKKYDIDILANYELLEKMEEAVEDSGEDLPIIFVGDSVFYGPDEARQKLSSTIELLSRRRKSTAQDTTPAAVDTIIPHIGDVHVYYFYQTGCKECDRIDILLGALERVYTHIDIRRCNTFDDSSKVLLEALSERTNIPDDMRLIVPILIIGHDYLIKEDITLKNVRALLEKYEQGGSRIDTINKMAAEQSIVERFSRFSIFGILIAGLLDGVNPCAFATLVFFVSYLLFIGKSRRDIILMATFFILAVFLAYLTIGIGAYNILTYLSSFNIIATVVFIGFGVVAIVLGVLSLRDYFVARSGAHDKMILQLPLGIKQRIHKNIREKSAIGGIILGSLLVGFIVALLEFGCTGQVYLPTITFMISKAGFTLRPMGALLVYNIMFIMPLVIIALLATFFTTKQVAQSLENKVPLVKLFTALLFFALGALLILSA
jgi:cytochrome c biogenesis protein CcdA